MCSQLSDGAHVADLLQALDLDARGFQAPAAG